MIIQENTNPDINKIRRDINEEFKKIIEEYHIKQKDIPNFIEDLKDNISIHDSCYDVSALIEFYYRLEKIVLHSNKSLQEIFKTISENLSDLFKSRYVEFLMLKDKCLEYSYITLPPCLVKFTRIVTGISPIIGMQIPLFEGSMFTKFIKNAKPRELITPEERLQSFRDFIEPNTKENIFKRNYVAPIFIIFFSYDYVFQVPLIVNNKIFGYFSFLQKGRFNERVKADIIMLSGKIANLIAMKKIDEERRNFCRKIKQAVAILEVVQKDDFKGYDYVISEVNQELLNFFSIEEKDIINIPISTLLSEQYAFLQDIFQLVYITGKPEVLDIHFIKSQKILRSAISKTENDNILVIGEDVTEKMKLAEYDKLTEVYNRHTFLEKCKTGIINADKNNSMYALFFLDLDQFKQVNDTYGHDTGDQYLCSVANVLRISLRKNDIIGRYGGDEFTVFSLVNDHNDAEKIAGKIRDVISSIRIDIPAGYIAGSASIGIACYQSSNMEDVAELVRQSDEAMYCAKRNGIGYCFYDSILEDNAIHV